MTGAGDLSSIKGSLGWVISKTVTQNLEGPNGRPEIRESLTPPPPSTQPPEILSTHGQALALEQTSPRADRMSKVVVYTACVIEWNVSINVADVMAHV